MKNMKLRILITILIVAMALLFAGCKGESSPTAPSTSTNPPTQTVPPTTPPSNATITLTASNTSPTAPADVIITATVQVNGAPAPDGTAVQFVTTIGTFKDSATASTIRITAAGVATATVTSASAGTGTVTATVNNVQKSINLTFNAQPPAPAPGPSTTPTITTVSPTTGIPQGGTILTINGTNFRAPVRVLVTPNGGGTSKDAFVQSVTATQIVAVMPAFEITTGQTLAVDITVIDEAGTGAETPVTKANAFTYQNAVLTPVIRTISPTSGPIDGGTRVAIIGDAFQAPVQVFFGSAEAQVLSVSFSRIDVVAPTARETAPNASGVVTGPVDVLVRNVASNKSTTSPQQFRYIAAMQITTVGPTEGPFTGGTRVKIDGTGFNAPLAVGIGGFAATVISVSATEVVAITPTIAVQACADVTGPIVITNTDNGDSASGPNFIYRVLKPAILSASPATSGGNSTVVVANAVGLALISVKGIPVQITATTVNANGTTSFTIVVPSQQLLPLTLVACPAIPGVNGTASAPQPTPFDITYKSATTTCTDTLANGLLVSPPTGPAIGVAGAFAPFVGVITPAQVGPPAVPASVAVSPASESVAIVNIGNGAPPLTINSITTSNVGGVNGCSAFSISSTPPPVVSLNQCDAFVVSASYNGQTTPTPSPDQCQITVSTNAGTKSFVISGSSH